MRIYSIIGLVFALALLGAVAYGANYQINFDENGNGTVNGTPINHYMVDERPAAGPGFALVYNVGLGYGWDAGDLLIYEDQNQTLLSDIVRFNPNGTISFYSAGGDADLADGAWPITPNGRVSLTEVGTEGNNWVDFTPMVPGTPGWVSGGNTVSYHIISDVPEPSSLLALLCGFGGIGGLLWKRIR